MSERGGQMPKYLFDLISGDKHLVDVEGVELPDDEAARATALQSLADLAHNDIPQGGDSSIGILVRRGPVPIYSATMTLSEQWLRLDS
ncbi:MULTISPECIES: hypothetical protein [unclassified Bosea (in: a-proteobacteria)]|uniref:DUF6894 family protein n=1 Tax=unclassified Bosea (in: a-proteobacteria) TaxID=2653178 RepID=UPI000F7DD905|nr:MULTISPECIES: hypothetical protein [unclassified Bosea (in: a-proteobacteria)]